jgi:RimJ/RimL family protein N-acetyltransferase
MESYQRWMSTGEWREFDAPWEREPGGGDDGEAERIFRRNFLEELSDPRHRLIVGLHDSRPIGWVNRYEDKRFPSSWSVGIDICEDEHLNRGYGTEALRLWVDYLFLNSDIHRIAFATYSFNSRVVRIGQKLKFALEGRDREILQWQDRWLDRLHFSMLRAEWESEQRRDERSGKCS